jgi:hypothetical protein
MAGFTSPYAYLVRCVHGEDFGCFKTCTVAKDKRRYSFRNDTPLGTIRGNKLSPPHTLKRVGQGKRVTMLAHTERKRRC